MNHFRKYGKHPYQVAVIHGGPGAPGSMAPVAQELSQWCGVVELFQTKDTIAGLIAEMKVLLEQESSCPVTLIGHSWGAWLSYLFAAHYPGLVHKLILVGAGPFEAQYVVKMNATRDARLSAAEKRRVQELSEILTDPETPDKAGALQELGRIMAGVDGFKPLAELDEAIEVQPEAFLRLMQEINILRNSGELLERGKQIRCPVIGIQGDYDPHPAEGVRDPLAGVIADFYWVLLKNCGHTPWNEQMARDNFYLLLKLQLEINDRLFGEVQ